MLLFALPPPAAFAEARGFVASGDITHDSAVVWSRLDRPGVLEISLQKAAGGTPLAQTRRVTAEHDFTAHLRFRGLQPATEYLYRAEAIGHGKARSLVGSGRLRTPPLPNLPHEVRFSWGGDLGGHHVCRDRREGFPIFAALNRARWDFFIGMGDMIYADQDCPARGAFGNEQIEGPGPATDLPGFWAHWKYNLGDPGFREFLGATPYFPVWDDHEVYNDFGPHHDTGDRPPYVPGVHLLPLGLAALLDYHPIDSESGRLYRSMRWGKHVEIFLLDTRQYRDANSAADSQDHPKTLLGRKQLGWLKARLKASDATWKFIVSSVPLSTPTGVPDRPERDGWANGGGATGFEQELLDLFAFMRTSQIRNCVWLAADVHFAAGNRLHPYPDEPDFLAYEFISGPMSAGLYPNPHLDPTLRPERLFFFGPEDRKKVTDFRQAKHWLNVGTAEVSRDGELDITIVNAEGKTVANSGPLRPQGSQSFLP